MLLFTKNTYCAIPAPPVSFGEFAVIVIAPSPGEQLKLAIVGAVLSICTVIVPADDSFPALSYVYATTSVFPAAVTFTVAVLPVVYVKLGFAVLPSVLVPYPI